MKHTHDDTDKSNLKLALDAMKVQNRFILHVLFPHTRILACTECANAATCKNFVVGVQDLAQYVNEVKRDNETLREIDQYQKSIENLVRICDFSFFTRHSPLKHSSQTSACFSLARQNQPLSNYGRPKGDGEVRVTSVDKRAKQDR